MYDNERSLRKLNNFTPVRTLMNEIIEPIDGQTIIRLPKKYSPGRNELEVLLNGIPQRTNIEYYEISDDTIQFTEPLEAKDIVQCIIRGAYVVSKTHVYELERDTEVLPLDAPYKVGGDTIMVFADGRLLTKNRHYYEEDEYTIRFEDRLPFGTEVVIHEVR